MSKHVRYLLQGVVLVAPLAVTLYVLIAIAMALDKSFLWVYAKAAGKSLEEVDIPFGIGLVVTVAALYLIGWLGQIWIFDRLIGFGENLLQRIPLLKTLYSSVKDMLQFVIGGKDKMTGRPVTYKVPGMNLKMLGVVTNDGPPEAMEKGNEGAVCVYFPMSYQIGGFTYLVPRDALEEVPTDGITMMRLAMTAGVGRKEGESKKPAAAGPPADGESA